MDEVMATVHQSTMVALDDLLPQLRDSYEQARFVHELDHLPATLDDCVNTKTSNPGLFKKDNPNPLLVVGLCYGVFKDLLSIEPVGEVTFKNTLDIQHIVSTLDRNYYLVPRIDSHKTRPVRFLSPTGEMITSWVTESNVTYDQEYGVKIADIIQADYEKKLCWELNREYVLYNFLEEAAISFIASLARYRNARSLITSSVVTNSFEANFPGTIDLGIQDVLKDECYNILEPLYSRLAMAKVHVWSYYKTKLYGPLLFVDRHEDYRVVEWYSTMFEAKELREYLALSKEIGYH